MTTMGTILHYSNFWFFPDVVPVINAGCISSFILLRVSYEAYALVDLVLLSTYGFFLN
jgi:hypothetical protein